MSLNSLQLCKRHVIVSPLFCFSSTGQKKAVMWKEVKWKCFMTPGTLVSPGSRQHEVGLQSLRPIYSVYTTFLFTESSPVLNIRAIHKTLNDTEWYNGVLERGNRKVAGPIDHQRVRKRWVEEKTLYGFVYCCKKFVVFVDDFLFWGPRESSLTFKARYKSRNVWGEDRRWCSWNMEDPETHTWVLSTWLQHLTHRLKMFSHPAPMSRSSAPFPLSLFHACVVHLFIYSVE